MSAEDVQRWQILRRLDAARPHLERAPLYDVARELVVQGLDVVEPALRRRLVRDAIAELDTDSGD